MKSYKKGFEAFVEKANKIHNNKYKYVKESYIKSTENCTIICPRHGEFFKRPDVHTNQGQGCPDCSTENRLNHDNLKWYTVDIEKLIEDKSFVYIPEKDFVFKKTKLKFYCDIHKEFTRTIIDIESGKGCKECDKLKYQEEQRLKRKQEFLEKASKLHKNRYNYDGIDYQGAFNIIQIYCNTCKKHFPQKPREHLQGNGCQICGKNASKDKLKITLDKFLIRVKGLYEGIDYSKLSFESIEDIGIFICEEHGEYEQKVSNHLRHKGCEGCVKDNIKKVLSLTEKEFLERVKTNTKYDYSFVVYKGLRETIQLKCKKHDYLFDTTPYAMLYYSEHTNLCPKCQKKTKSVKESEIKDFLETQGLKVIQSYRPKWLKGKEIDLYVPELNLGVEYNGVITHHSSVTNIPFFDNRTKDSDYHLNKYITCKNNNLDLLHIFEFEDLLSWYELLLLYINNPDQYEITFQNNIRYYDRKEVVLSYYGQSFIKPITQSRGNV